LGFTASTQSRTLTAPFKRQSAESLIFRDMLSNAASCRAFGVGGGYNFESRVRHYLGTK
jgi:hypothetical protein